MAGQLKSAKIRQTLLEIAEGEVVFVVKCRKFSHFSDPVKIAEFLRAAALMMPCEMVLTIEKP
jgi:hypothetical protein